MPIPKLPDLIENLRLAAVGLVCLAATSATAGATDRADVFLILAVDVSGSIEPEERAFQRTAYQEVLVDPEIARAIAGGRRGQIALGYMEWASGVVFDHVVPPQLVRGADDLAQIAAAIADHGRPGPHSARTGSTSVGQALQEAWAAMDTSPIRADRYVIDISGDGLANDGPWVGPIRDDLVWHGVTINGLPLLYRTYGPHEPILLDYYTTCVVGGAGSFVLPVETREDFKDALKAKMILEIADLAKPRAEIWQADFADAEPAALKPVCR